MSGTQLLFVQIRRELADMQYPLKLRIYGEGMKNS